MLVLRKELIMRNWLTKAVVPVMVSTGFRFSERYRMEYDLRFISIYRLIYSMIDTVRANCLAKGIDDMECVAIVKKNKFASVPAGRTLPYVPISRRRLRL